MISAFCLSSLDKKYGQHLNFCPAFTKSSISSISCLKNESSFLKYIYFY